MTKPKDNRLGIAVIVDRGSGVEQASLLSLPVGKFTQFPLSFGNKKPS
jgi:hypothetical protein